MEKLFNRFANATAKVTGRPWTFIACVMLVVVWAATGPIFKFNETWQLVINTGTTIITFLMVFLIQNTQNRDAAAMHAKVDELIHAVKSADERFIGIEHLTDADLAQILEQVEARASRIHGEGADARPVVATRAEDRQKARRTVSARRRPSRQRSKGKAAA